MFISKIFFCNIIVFSIKKIIDLTVKKKSLNSGINYLPPSISKEEQTRFSKAKN
jgi:hypothetical protein